MGTWSLHPLANDSALDWLQEAAASPARGVTRALTAVVRAAPDAYLDIDEAAPAWAACELVALAFGRGDASALAPSQVEFLTRLKPKDDQRLLALQALARVANATTSELGALWHEGDGGPAFEAAVSDLRERLEAAAKGPIAAPKAAPGDVVVLGAPSSAGLVVVQVIGNGEVAVFDGLHASKQAALAALAKAPARRVPTNVVRLRSMGETIANEPLRKDLKGKRLYGVEVGPIEEYAVCTASGGGFREATYEETRDLDLHRLLDPEAILAFATENASPPRVRTPDEREASIRATHAAKWAERRKATSPGPFGDPEALRYLIKWIDDTSVATLVRSQHSLALGGHGYGRPSEGAERIPYAFAGLVAIWSGAWPSDRWPAAAGPLPMAPSAAEQRLALTAARALVEQVITRDAELRMMWTDDSGQGTALTDEIEALRLALG